MIELAELTVSKEEALRLHGSAAPIARTLQDLIDDMEACIKIANGMKYINMAEEAMKNTEENSVERAFVALDLLSEAKNTTKHVDMKVFCKAKLYQGKIFVDLLADKDKARACFKEVIDVSLSQQYVNSIWFKEASALFQQIKKTEVVVKTPDEKRKVIIKDLEAELKELDDAQKKNDEDFVSFILARFPPKHVQNFKKPEVSQTFSVIMKALSKVGAYYHPDKVDASIHGEKYKVLCEEITKRVNARYSRLKSES